jgi:hypothetical protein
MVIYDIFKSVEAGAAMQPCVNSKDFSEYTYNDVLHFGSADATENAEHRYIQKFGDAFAINESRG